jgi:hypothetical protein
MNIGYMLRICSCFFALYILAQHSLSAQTPNPPHWGAALHRGFIIPHSPELIDVSRSNPLGFELNMHWLLHQEQQVRQTGLIAKRGFAAYFIHFQNPEVLGYSAAVVPYVEPLIRPWKRLHGGVQVGLGPAYVSKVYDEQTNPTNIFFSLPISLWVMLNTHVYYRLSPRWTLAGGFNYNHISNGGMKNPNKGMNFPTFNAGLQWTMHNIKVQKPIKNDDWKREKRRFQYVALIGSVKNVPASADFPKIEPAPLYGAQWMIGWRTGRLSSFSLGTEWIFDGYDRTLLDRVNDGTSTWKGGLLVGHELLVGRVRFGIHLGPYVFNPSRTTDALYQRYGLHYRLGRHLLVGSTLKAHRHIADVFDIRVGYIW